MTRHAAVFATGLAMVLGAALCWAAQQRWKPNDKARPLPPVVEPGDRPSDPPSDAIVLFGGKDLSQWEDASGKGPAKWKVEDGVMKIVPRSGSIRTKQAFGDCQLHLEWKPLGGDHGNSGVFFMGQYELQIYDSYKNKQRIYADGVAGGKYGQYPPQVNACKPSGQWQVFDATFHAPEFDDDGKVVKPATMTAFLNGVLVLDHVKLKGFTVHNREATYRKHPPKLPLMLQDHGDRVWFRNIWIRPLPAGPT